METDRGVLPLNALTLSVLGKAMAFNIHLSYVALLPTHRYKDPSLKR